MTAWIFIGEHLVEILFALLSAGALAFCKHLWNQNKKYKQFEENEKERKLEEHFEEKIKAVLDEIEELRDYIRKTDKKEKHDMALIISSYKFRLVQLCRIYLQQGYMTNDQFQQINTFYQLYRDLGGNGEAENYYNKIKQLEIISE